MPPAPLGWYLILVRVVDNVKVEVHNEPGWLRMGIIGRSKVRHFDVDCTNSAKLLLHSFHSKKDI